MSGQVFGLPGRPDAFEQRTFCSHCGMPPDVGATDVSFESRVCQHCDLGLVLHAAIDVVPAPGEPFLVVDNRMAIGALSLHAEQLLGVQETAAVNRHLGEFLVPADANHGGEGGILELVLVAVGHGGPARRVVVRPRGLFGVRFTARIGRCGPSASALVVLER